MLCRPVLHQSAGQSGASLTWSSDWYQTGQQTGASQVFALQHTVNICKDLSDL